MVFDTYITRDFSKLAKIWENVYGSHGVSVQPFSHPQSMKVLNSHIHV